MHSKQIIRTLDKRGQLSLNVEVSTPVQQSAMAQFQYELVVRYPDVVNGHFKK